MNLHYHSKHCGGEVEMDAVCIAEIKIVDPTWWWSIFTGYKFSFSIGEEIFFGFADTMNFLAVVACDVVGEISF